MKKKGKIKISNVLVLIILIALAHTGGHFLIFGTGIESIDQAVLSGLAIGDISIFEGIKQKYDTIPNTSRFIIAGEWLVVLGIILIILMKGRMDLKKDTSHVNKEVKHEKPKPKTDLDILYEMLKKRKSMRILSISKIFGVKKEIAMDWCNILESGDLAEIKYPIVGSPKLILPETPKKNNKKEVKKDEKKEVRDYKKEVKKGGKKKARDYKKEVKKGGKKKAKEKRKKKQKKGKH